MDVISTTGSTKTVNFLSNYCRSCSTICENMTPLQAFNADQNSEQLLTFFNIKVLILKLRSKFEYTWPGTKLRRSTLVE